MKNSMKNSIWTLTKYHKYMSGICNKSSFMSITVVQNLESSGLKLWGAAASLQNGHHIDTSFQSTAVTSVAFMCVFLWSSSSGSAVASVANSHSAFVALDQQLLLLAAGK